MNIDAWIAERERIAEAATAGPWQWSPSEIGPQLEGGNDYADMNPVLVANGCRNEGLTPSGVKGCMPDKLGDELRACPLHPSKQDRDFIADARTSLPAALAWMKEAAKVLDWMAKQPCACRDGWRCWRCECVRLRVSGPGGE